MHLVREVYSAGRVLAFGAALLAIVAFGHLIYVMLAYASPDPDDFRAIAAGADVTLTLVIGAIAGAIAIVPLVVSTLVDRSLRTRMALCWIVAALVPWLTLAVLWVRATR